MPRYHAKSKDQVMRTWRGRRPGMPLMQESSLRDAISAQIDSYERAVRKEISRAGGSAAARDLEAPPLHSMLAEPVPAWVSVMEGSTVRFRSSMIVTDEQEGYCAAFDLTDAQFVVVRRGVEGYEATEISGDIVKCLLSLAELRKLKRLLHAPIRPLHALDADLP
jgi:hypothetical protein